MLAPVLYSSLLYPIFPRTFLISLHIPCRIFRKYGEKVLENILYNGYNKPRYPFVWN